MWLLRLLRNGEDTSGRNGFSLLRQLGRLGLLDQLGLIFLPFNVLERFLVDRKWDNRGSGLLGLRLLKLALLLLDLLELVLRNLLNDRLRPLVVNRDQLNRFPARLDRDRDEGLLPGKVPVGCGLGLARAFGDRCLAGERSARFFAERNGSEICRLGGLQRRPHNARRVYRCKS